MAVMSAIRNMMFARRREVFVRNPPGTVETIDPETGEVSLRRATPDEQAYAREVIRCIEQSLPSPRKPWSEEPAEPRSWGADGGIESVYQAPLELAPPPFWMPASGVCCAFCPGVRDRRCCARGS